MNTPGRGAVIPNLNLLYYPTMRILLKITLLLVIALTATPAIAQDAAPPQPAPEQQAVSVPKRFESPRATMFAFLEAMGSSDLGRAIDCFDIPQSSRESGVEISARLYNVINRIGEIAPYQLPDAHNAEGLDAFSYFPSDDHRQDELLELAPNARIEFVRTDDGAWKLSRRTYEGASDFFRRVEHLPVRFGNESLTIPMRIRSAFPSALRRGEFLGVEHWQWLGLLGLLVLSVVLDFTIRVIIATIARAVIARRHGHVEPKSIKAFVRPFGLLAGSAFALLLIWTLGLPPVAMLVLMPALRLILAVAGVWSAMRLTDLVAEHLQSKALDTQTKIDDLLIPLLRKSVKIFIFAVGLIYIANSLSIEILPLLTGLGIGGLAVAFAAKDTIENFFGSIAVIVDHPFEVGDWILVDGAEGTVEEIGFRSTRIRTFYNSLVTVPNSTLVRAKVDNFGRRQYRRFTTKLNVTYDTHPDKIEAFCSGIREITKLHPYTRKDYYHVWLNGFGPHSLDILVYIFFECPDWSIELREKHRFMLDVVRLADRLGVEFAFPTQKIHISKDDIPADKLENPEANSERRWVLEGRKAAREITADQPWKSELPGEVSFAEEFESEHEARGDSAG